MRYLKIGGGVFGAIVLAFVVWVSFLPESGVKLTNEMDEYALRSLEEHNVLQPGEEIVAYYDVTISMNGSEAAVVTNRRVLYLKDGRTTAIDLSDIRSVEHRYESMIGDIIEVEASSGTYLKIEIAPMNQGATFLSVLQRQVERVKETR